MKVLKSEKFTAHNSLTKFINQQKIEREDILSINTPNFASSSEYVVFFYHDENVELPKKGFWD
ncbi:hypothetical protein [Mucilaginibacter auburnensis]|uniref:Uncharacterized protein n=1 Tax=Mucilaginibacter auburnensis TaxID=1457233 RepID=A0A2H9VNP5_9SPHI|nr:hypothetical protein [Mucilaginibacter auburnensis]PJJ79964.1 hypothetical protein CLV57_3103 [Mucilaginibacter auburnensis]